ncbi:MAG: Hsp70 family protein [Pyrinomonadaceae bacterium]
MPQELAGNAVDVSIIILDRQAQNAVAICANLRKQSEFKSVPVLVLLEGADQSQIAQLGGMGADLFFKPVVSKALSRYLTTRVPSLQTTKEKEPADVPVSERPTEVLNPLDTLDEKDAGSQRTVSLLDDIIPTSNRLLPQTILPMIVAKGGVPCAHCGRWRVRREDAFCSKCRAALAVLETPGEVVFEPQGEHRVGQLIELKNAGQNPLRLSFNIIADKELIKRFSLHTNAASLEGGEAEHLLSNFDAHKLDLTTRYQAVLEITSNADGYSKRQVPLIVERLPIPRIVTQESYPYVLGAENFWDIRLTNDGGGTLTLSKVRFDETATGLLSTTTELELLAPVVVEGGRSTEMRLRVPQLELAPGRFIKKIICEFERHLPVEVDLTIEAVRPARLAVQPPELDFEVVSTQRSRRLSLQLVNGGGEELIIQSIAASVDWMECFVKTPLSIQAGNAYVVDVQVQGAPERAGDLSTEIKIESNSYQSTQQTVPCIVKFVNPAPYEEYIGIDFGTTASCVAVLDKDDTPFVIPLDSIEPGSQSDARIMPSVLFFHPDGSIIAGREALNDADIQPANAVTSIKRVLGGKHTETLAGREFNPTELTSKIIEQLMLRTENALFQLGEYKTPRRAIVTVPVEIFDNQRRALLEACQMAGLEMRTSSKHGVVIDEAHAAALYYLSKKPPSDKEDGPERLLIFDFGGGTLDCALIEIEAAETKVLLKTLAPGGDPRLGGEDIDWALVHLLADKAKKEYPEFDINCLGDRQKFSHHFRTPEIARAAYMTRAHFKRQAELAKISLTKVPAVELTIEPLLRVGATPLESYIMNGAGPARFKATLKREELETTVEPFLKRAAGVVETLCERAGVARKDVQTVLHVGRTSLLPMVRKRINKLLPNAEDRSSLIEPKLCVALGAAFWGQIKDQPRANFEFVGGANRLIHDIGYVDFLTGMLRQIFVPVFPAQTEFPCERVIELPLSKEVITLQLAENRGKGQFIDGNPEIKKIGRVRIDVRDASGPSIPIKFAMDENRVLKITANGQTQDIEMMDE